MNKRSKVGVITNGFVTAQREKICVCQIDQSIDFIVVFEEAGFKKPSREIFKVALQRAEQNFLRQHTWVIHGLLTLCQHTTAESKRFG